MKDDSNDQPGDDEIVVKGTAQGGPRSLALPGEPSKFKQFLAKWIPFIKQKSAEDLEVAHKSGVARLEKEIQVTEKLKLENQILALEVIEKQLEVAQKIAKATHRKDEVEHSIKQQFASEGLNESEQLKVVNGRVIELIKLIESKGGSVELEEVPNLREMSPLENSEEAE